MYVGSDHCEHSDGANDGKVVVEVDEDPLLKRWPGGFDVQRRLECVMTVMMVDDQMVKCNLMQKVRSESETSDGGETDDEGIRSQLRLASSIIRKENQ